MSQTLVVQDPLAELTRLDGVPSAVAAARDAVDAVLRDRGQRRFTPEQRAAALLRGARASADLTTDPSRWLPGCVRVSTELLELAPLMRRAVGQALARIHVLLTSGVVTPDGAGRPSARVDAMARMTELGRVLTRPTAAPAIVVAAVTHAEVASAAPFESANDLVARTAEQLVLMEYGVDPEAAIPVPAGHRHLATAYAGALAAYGRGTALGVREWILHCCSALTSAAEDTS